jgi:EamA domain-containing membrane protein RarD
MLGTRADDRGTTLLNLVLPVLTMSITFAFYTLVQKKELTASKGKLVAMITLMPVFTSMTVFEVVKGQMGMVCPRR